MKVKYLIIVTALLVVLSAFALASCGGNDGTDTEETAPVTDKPADPGTETDTDVPETRREIVAEYTYDDNGKKTGSRGFDTDGVLLFEEKYDVAGRTSERTDYNEDGSVSAVSNYTFLSGDEPDHYTVESYEYEDGEVIRKNVVRYNRMGLAESYYSYDPDDSLIEAYLYEYGDTGLIVKESLVDSNNALKLITEYEYENGLLVKQIYKKGSGALASYSEFTYNDNGTIARESCYDADGNFTSYLEYVYDENGKFVEEIEYIRDEDGSFIQF